MLNNYWCQYLKSTAPEYQNSFEIEFYNNGNFLAPILQKDVGSIKNSKNFNFAVFRLHSDNNNFFLTLYFFDTKEPAKTYGSKFEKLTIDDLYLVTEKKFYYFPNEIGFILVPCDS